LAGSSRARRLRELVSHWRGHGKSPEPMPQHELPEPAKEGYRSCAFAYAAKRRLLLVRIKQVLNDAIYNDTYRSVQELATSLKPTSLIIDLSAVKKFDLSYPFLIQVGELKPAMRPMPRYVVAPDPAVYNANHIIETLRTASKAPITTVHHIREIYERFGVAESDFAVVEPSEPAERPT